VISPDNVLDGASGLTFIPGTVPAAVMPTVAALGSTNLQPSDFLGGGAAGATGAATGGIVPVTQTQVQGGVSFGDQSSNTVHNVLKPPGS
jgi:hypothetical protein